MKKIILFCGVLAVACLLLSFTNKNEKPQASSKSSATQLSSPAKSIPTSTSGPFVLEPMTQF
jgi:hypothetical protein